MTEAAVYFHLDGYTTHRDDLKGRHVAGESFLIGFMRYGGEGELVCLAENEETAAGFRSLAGLHAPGRPVRSVWPGRLQDLVEPGCLFIPGANIDNFVWARRSVGQRLYSLCGVAHTTAEAPHRIGSLLTTPVQPWDAVICTSEAARSTMEAVLLPYADYLRSRLGATQVPIPRLPVIPLGIDTTRLRFDASVRGEERQKLDIAPDDIAVLYIGRLSFHAKAHPLPMYQALQKAAETTGKRIHLIQAGWFPNQPIADAFIEGAKRYCPSVRVLFLDGRKPEVRDRIWAAADLYTSLADNVQETFGLSPIEAMAAGLPGVISDWNGYRETLRHGVDGFRIPTLLPPADSGQDIAGFYSRGAVSYDGYIGLLSQLTSVDIEASAQAYSRLIEDADLRRKMGENARAHAARFDWAAVIPLYRDLWRELAEVRRSSGEIAPWGGACQSNPLAPDPFAMFASYPTEALSPQMRMVCTSGASLGEVAALLADPLNSVAEHVIATRAEIALILDRLTPPGATVGDLLILAPAERRIIWARTLVHLAKVGQLRKVD